MKEVDKDHLQEVSDETLELLPWFLNATLTEDEAAAVAHRLRSSPAAREEMERVRELALAVQSQHASAWQPSARHFQEILAQVDADERGSQGMFARGWQRVCDWVRSIGPGATWAIAVQACVIVALVAWLVPLPSAPEEATFETLSARRDGGQWPRALDVIFAPQASVVDMRALVDAVHGVVVDGPSALGVFTIVIANDTDIETAQAVLDNSTVTLLVQAHTAGSKK